MQFPWLLLIALSTLLSALHRIRFARTNPRVPRDEPHHGIMHQHYPMQLRNTVRAYSGVNLQKHTQSLRRLRTPFRFSTEFAANTVLFSFIDNEAPVTVHIAPPASESIILAAL